MSIELIIFLVIWFISTEVIFFRNRERNNRDFFYNKMASILCGGIAAIVIFGFPTFFANVPPMPGDDAIGNVVYFWYYGIIVSVGLFFFINYKVGEWLDNKHRRNRRAKRKAKVKK